MENDLLREAMSNSTVASGACVLLFAVVSLALAALARKALKYEVENARLRGSIGGINISIVGSIAAWLGSFLVLNLVWLEWAWPAFEQSASRYEVWTIEGDISYERGDAFVSATEDVDVYFIPKTYRLVGGLFSMQMPVLKNPGGQDWPAIRFVKGDCHTNEMRHPRIGPAVTIDDEARTINLGKIELSLLDTTPESLLQSEENPGPDADRCTHLYGS